MGCFVRAETVAGTTLSIAGAIGLPLAALLALPLSAGPAAAACPEAAPDRPRTLILALDGVPLRVVDEARRRGAFRDWPTPVPLVSTFPSLTNVAFTAMFQPFGVEPASGYEVGYYDRDKNALVGRSPFGYHERVFAWREIFDLTGKTVRGKLAIYSRPRKKALKEFEEARRLLMDSGQELVLAHSGATDAMIHLRGDEPAVRLLLQIDARLRELRRRHLEVHGRPLRVVLISDHGNGRTKVRPLKGIRRRLRKAGLRLRKRLQGPDDVIAATFGLVAYGGLFVAPARAELAARAVARHEQVDLAAWVSGEREVTVVSGSGEARILWRDAVSGRRFAYLPEESADPLRLRTALDRMRSDERLDAEGFASADDWLAATVNSDYPDPLHRLVDGLDAPYVRSRASVLFSVTPGYAWGWNSAHAGSWFKGGRLEGTHGGLDRDSSLAFFLTDDPEIAPHGPLSADRALAMFAPLVACRDGETLEPTASRIEAQEAGAEGRGQSAKPE